MNIHKHLYVTYDNDRLYFSVSYCNSNYFVSYETKVKEKDNRSAFHTRSGYRFSEHKMSIANSKNP